jgi:hypothetical protein
MTAPKTARITSGKSSLGSFLTKHADELGTVAAALGTIVRVIPMDPATKRGLNVAIGGLSEAAGRIAESAPKANAVSLSLADIREAVGPILADLVKPMVAELLSEALAGEVITKAVAEAVAAKVAADPVAAALAKANAAGGAS